MWVQTATHRLFDVTTISVDFHVTPIARDSVEVVDAEGLPSVLFDSGERCHYHSEVGNVTVPKAVMYCELDGD